MHMYIKETLLVIINARNISFSVDPRKSIPTDLHETIVVQFLCKTLRGSRGRDRMVVGFMTTYASRRYHH